MSNTYRVAMILLPFMDFVFSFIIVKMKYPFIIDRETLKDHNALRVLQKFIYRELRLNIYVTIIRLLTIIDFIVVSLYYQNLVFCFFIVNIFILYLMLYNLEKIIALIKMIKCFNYTFFVYNKKKEDSDNLVNSSNT